MLRTDRQYTGIAIPTAVTCFAHLPITGRPVKRSRSTKDEAFQANNYSSQGSKQSFVSKERRVRYPKGVSLFEE